LFIAALFFVYSRSVFGLEPLFFWSRATLFWCSVDFFWFSAALFFGIASFELEALSLVQRFFLWIHFDTKKKWFWYFSIQILSESFLLKFFVFHEP